MSAARFYWPDSIAWLFAGVLALPFLWFCSLYASVPWARGPAWMAGALLVAWALSMLLAQPLWRLSSRRRPVFRLVWPALFGSCLVAFLLAAREAQHRDDTALNARMAALRQGVRNQAARQAAQALAELEDRAQRARADRFVQYEGRIEDSLLDTLRALDREMQEAFAARADRFRAVLAETDVRGPESWIRARQPEELIAERNGYQRLYEEGRALLLYIDGFADAYRARIDALALQPPADRIAIAELERILQFWEAGNMRAVREIDVEATAVALQILDLLRQEWGRWQFDSVRQRITFASLETEYSFARLLSQWQELLTAGKELVEKPSP
jgi:hypothetical protein